MSQEKQEAGQRDALSRERATSILEAMKVEDRVQAIHSDIESGAKRFASVEAFDLARLLEVPQPEMPENSWSFVTAAEVRQLENNYEEGRFDSGEDIAAMCGELVSAVRLKEIEADCAAFDRGDRGDWCFLRPEEREALERILAKQELEELCQNGIGCTASYCVSRGEFELWFRGEIEDDGACIFLSTPYDGIDGPVTKLDDPNFVCEEW